MLSLTMRLRINNIATFKQPSQNNIILEYPYRKIKQANPGQNNRSNKNLYVLDVNVDIFTRNLMVNGSIDTT
jgi:hypothetical protein